MQRNTNRAGCREHNHQPDWHLLDVQPSPVVPADEDDCRNQDQALHHVATCRQRETPLGLLRGHT
jgi:hypothetical protein